MLLYQTERYAGRTVVIHHGLTHWKTNVRVCTPLYMRLFVGVMVEASMQRKG